MRSMSGEPVLGVSAFVVHDGRLLMVRRARGTYAGRWSLPGGRVEPRERLAAALRREVAEETGLRIRVGELSSVREVLSGADHHVILVYRARVTGGELQAGDDAAAAEWVALDAVRRRTTTPGLLALIRRIA